MRRPKHPPVRVINGHTLEVVVRRYLAELDNPAPDFRQRDMYRKWMAEFVLTTPKDET